MKAPVISDAAISAFVNQVDSVVALEMVRQAEAVFVRDAQDNLNVPRPHRGRTGFGTNPPPGPPYRRSGDLVRSIHAEAPQIESGHLVVYVASDPSSSSHEHYQPDYARWLLDQQYDFLTPAVTELLDFNV